MPLRKIPFEIIRTLWAKVIIQPKPFKGPEEIYAKVARFIGLQEDDFPTAQALLKACDSTDFKKDFF